MVPFIVAVVQTAVRALPTGGSRAVFRRGSPCDPEPPVRPAWRPGRAQPGAPAQGPPNSGPDDLQYGRPEAGHRIARRQARPTGSGSPGGGGVATGDRVGRARRLPIARSRPNSRGEAKRLPGSLRPRGPAWGDPPGTTGHFSAAPAPAVAHRGARRSLSQPRPRTQPRLALFAVLPAFFPRTFALSALSSFDLTRRRFTLARNRGPARATLPRALKEGLPGPSTGSEVFSGIFSEEA